MFSSRLPGPHKVQLQDKDITTDIRQRFEELCEEYREAFSKNNEDINRTKLVKMDIATGDSPPVSSRPYTLHLKHYEWVQREIESLECLCDHRKYIQMGEPNSRSP